jgi:hypothetical protein
LEDLRIGGWEDLDAKNPILKSSNPPILEFLAGFPAMEAPAVEIHWKCCSFRGGQSFAKS